MYILIILVIGILLLNFLPLIGLNSCVGVVSVTGEIATTSGYGVQSSSDVVSLLNTAENSPNIRSVVLVIDSPGGSPVAADEIYTSLRNMSKPTVAYISDEGASGAYFVALGTDRIFANPYSITGSIGVRTDAIYDLSGLMNYTGVNETTIKSGSMKDVGDIYRPLTNNETVLLQTMINQMAVDFMNVVNQSRSGKNNRYSIASLNEVSDARVLTGEQAYDLGLVDQLGVQQDAINYAAAEAGMGPNPQICQLQVQTSLLGSLFESMGRGIGESMSNVLISQNNIKLS